MYNNGLYGYYGFRAVILHTFGVLARTSQAYITLVYGQWGRMRSSGPPLGGFVGAQCCGPRLKDFRIS